MYVKISILIIILCVCNRIEHQHLSVKDKGPFTTAYPPLHITRCYRYGRCRGRMKHRTEECMRCLTIDATPYRCPLPCFRDEESADLSCAGIGSSVLNRWQAGAGERENERGKG